MKFKDVKSNIVYQTSKKDITIIFLGKKGKDWEFIKHDFYGKENSERVMFGTVTKYDFDGCWDEEPGAYMFFLS